MKQKLHNETVLYEQSHSVLFLVQFKAPKGIYWLNKILLVHKLGHVCCVTVWEKWSDARGSTASAMKRSELKVGQNDEEEQRTWPGSIKQFYPAQGMPQTANAVYISWVCDGKFSSGRSCPACELLVSLTLLSVGETWHDLKAALCVCVYWVRPAFCSRISCFLNQVSLHVVLLPLSWLLPEISRLFQECNSDTLSLSRVSPADAHKPALHFQCTLPSFIYKLFSYIKIKWSFFTTFLVKWRWNKFLFTATAH